MGLSIKVIKKKNYVYSIELTGSVDSDTYQQLEDEIDEIIKEEMKKLKV